MGKRQANNEGSIYNTIQKNKKKFDNTKMCKICSECTDRTLCNNRTGWDKCIKCKECQTECLKYCDRFYCYDKSFAQITVNKVQKTVANAQTKKDVAIKKREKYNILNSKTLFKNGELSLIESIKYIEEKKFKDTSICANSYLRNTDTINLISRYPDSNKKLKDLTEEDMKQLLIFFRNNFYSQSQLEKIYDEINSVFGFSDLKRNTIIAIKNKKEIQAFTLEEEALLLDYIDNNEELLILDRKAKISSRTAKNLIKFLLAFGPRIGEACSIDLNNIDFDDFKIKIERSITRDENGKDIIGTHTKTGNKLKKHKKDDTRNVSFNVLFDDDYVTDFLKEQYDEAISNPNNTKNLLFCRLDGSLITHSSFNAMFKRICKQAGIKKECNNHMTKHTAVTRLIENGVDIYAISKIVGTSVDELHKTYAHIFDEFVYREIQKSLEKREKITPQKQFDNVVNFGDYKKLHSNYIQK